jgi:hypothetical protein
MKKRVSKSVRDACHKLANDDKALTKLANDAYNCLNVKYKVIALRGDNKKIHNGEIIANVDAFDYKNFIILRINGLDQIKREHILGVLREFRKKLKDDRFVLVIPSECEICKFEPIVQDDRMPEEPETRLLKDPIL